MAIYKKGFLGGPGTQGITEKAIVIQLAKKWPDMVVKWPFISCYFLRVSQACARPPSTSEAIMSEPIKM